MRIQHNIMAMNAYRNYNNNTSALSKNLEKLSSGYKINRAGDDAAGLAISEKMRAQISGLNAATKNVKDGISLVKTAEGAMQEVQDMLNRMSYLATQSANGTYDNEVDRANLQKEVTALKTEINRIADSANFNGINLLDGSLAGAKVTSTDGSVTTTGTPAVAAVWNSAVQTAVNTNAAGNMTIGGHAFQIDGTAVTGLADQLDAFVADYNANAADKDDWTASVHADGDKIVFTAKTAGALATTGATAPTGTTQETEGKDAAAGTPTNDAAKTEIDLTGLTGAQVLGGTIKVGSTTYEFVEDAADVTASNKAVVVTKDDDADAIAAALAGATAPTGFNAAAAGAKVTYTEAAPTGTTKAPAVEQNNMGGLTLQIGDTSDSYNQMAISIGDIHVAALGIDDVDIGSVDGAQTAIDKIKAAINSVSSTRGDLGAIQNRLEHTQNNLSVMAENIQDAESTIRDTDVADEMMAYTKNNILIQSAQAMLAQANAVPQGVLQLLQ